MFIKNMKLDEAITRRRSCRSYLDKSVPKSVIIKLLRMANYGELGTCYMGIMDFAQVSHKFGLPKDVVPICLVTLGYPKHPLPSKGVRRNIQELVHWHKF